MTERLWLDISATEYHDLPAVSSGGLKTYEKFGGLEYHSQYIAKTKVSEETTAKRLGTAFHCAMEDPDSWQTGYMLRPTIATDQGLLAIVRDLMPEKTKAAAPVLGEPLNMAMKFHKAYMELVEQDARANGKTLMTAAEYEIIDLQIASVYDNPECRDLVGQKTRSNVELACVWECPETGMPIKALVDLLVGDVVVDFKTTKAPNGYAFCRDADNYGYHFQAAHYLYVTGCAEFRFISVTSEALLKTGSHCEANVWRVPPRRLEDAHLKNLQVLQAVKDNTESAKTSEVDCQGVPFSWHNEGWSATLPLDVDHFRGDGLVGFEDE